MEWVGKGWGVFFVQCVCRAEGRNVAFTFQDIMGKIILYSSKGMIDLAQI